MTKSTKYRLNGNQWITNDEKSIVHHINSKNPLFVKRIWKIKFNKKNYLSTEKGLKKYQMNGMIVVRNRIKNNVLTKKMITIINRNNVYKN